MQIFDITNLIKEFDVLSNQYEALQRTLDNNTGFKTEYFNSQILINNLQAKINTQINQLLPINSLKRHKRGLIDGLGSIVKSLTGNLDQQDALRYDTEINTLKTNQHNIKSATDKQLTLLYDTINNFQELTQNLSHNQQILKDRVNNVIETINCLKIEMATAREYFRIQMVLTQIAMMYQNIYDILEQIQVAISFTKLNNFHSSIVRPSELLNELILVNKELSSEKLPFEPIPENILNFEAVLDVKSYSKNREIVFIIEVPLVEKENYNFVQLFPLPTPTDNYFKMIIPNFQFVIINEHNFGYSNIPCRKIFDNEYLCKHIHTEILYKNTPCEIQLLTYQHNITNCNPILVKIDSIQIQNIDEGKWIIVTDKDISAVQQCGSEKENVLLNGTRLAEISFPCSLKIADIVIKPYKNINNKFYVFPLPNIKFDVSHKIEHKDLKLVTLNNINLNKLEALQTKIKNQKIENLEMLKDPVYYYTPSIWTILLYIIIILILLFFLYKYLLPIFCVKEKPNNDDII